MDLKCLLDEKIKEIELLKRDNNRLKSVERHNSCERHANVQSRKATQAREKFQTLKKENIDLTLKLADIRRDLIKLQEQNNRLRKKNTVGRKGLTKGDKINTPYRKAFTDGDNNDGICSTQLATRTKLPRSKQLLTKTDENGNALNICIEYHQEEHDGYRHSLAQNEEMTHKIESLNREKDSLRAELDRYISLSVEQTSCFERDIQTQKNQMQLYEDFISKLKRKNEVVQSDHKLYISSAQRELSSLRHKIRKDQENMALLENEKEKLEQDSQTQILELTRYSKKETEKRCFEIQRHKKALENAQKAHYESQLNIQKLEQRITQAECELHDANEEIKSEKSRNAIFSKQIAQYNDKALGVEVLKKELQIERSRIAVLLNERAQYKESSATLRILTEELESERSKNAILLNERNKYKGQVEQMKTSQFDLEKYSVLLRQEHTHSEELRNATEHNQQLERQLSDLKTSGQALVVKIDYLNKEVRQLSNVLEGKERDMFMLNIELQRKHQEIEDRVSEIVMTKEKNLQNQGLVSVLQTKINQYKSNSKDMNPDSARLADTNSNLKRKLEKYQRELKKARSQLENATENNHQMERICSDLNEQMRELTMTKDSDINNLKFEFQRKCKEIENTMNELSFIKEQNKTNEQLVTDLQVELGRYKSDLNEKDSDAAKMGNTILNLRREVETYKIELNQARDELRNVTEITHEKSKKAFIDERDSLNDKVRELTNKLRRKDSEVDKMETIMADFSSIKEKNIKLERQVTDLQFEVNKYKSDLNDNSSASANLTNTISNLRREVETYQSELNKARNELRNATEKTQKMERQISVLKKSEQAFIDENGSLNDNVSELTNIIKGKDSNIRIIEAELAEHSLIKEENVKAERQITDLQIEIHKYKSELKDKVGNLTKLTNTISNLSHESERCESELKEAHKKIIKFDLLLKNVSEEHENCKHLISSLRKENEKLSMPKVDQTRRSEATFSQREHELSLALEKSRRELREVQHELDDTKTRLSKVMGQKLTDNNPNIADLSDKNRPTKLAERYSELYDNQWTDAFEVICKQLHDEQSTIKSLIEILMNAAKYCREEAKTQLESLQGILLPRKTGSTFPSLVHKNLKDCRKALGEQTGAAIYEKYLQDIAKQRQQSLQLDVKPYVKECVELCWLMSIQDPPVVVAPELQHGGNFDTDFYKAYTKSGPLIDYVVWPALCLHEKGPLLCKGIAQGYGGKKTKY